MLFRVVRPCVSWLRTLAGDPVYWVFGGVLGFLQACCRAVELSIWFLSSVFLFWQCFVFETEPKPPQRAPLLNSKALGVVQRELVRIRGSLWCQGQKRKSRLMAFKTWDELVPCLLLLSLLLGLVHVCWPDPKPG